MQFTTTKEKFQNAVAVAERLIGKKESLPVLSCVLLSVDKDLIISGTNLESGVNVRAQGEVGEKGVVAVPASILSQTIRSISGDKIVLKVDDGNLTISARGSKTLIKSISHDEFPMLPVSENKKQSLSINREKFLKGIQSVAYAASSSMIRPELGSVYISVRDGALTFAATDSFRLAEKIIKDTSVGEISIDILIPLRHAVELEHVLEHISDEKITVLLEDAHLTVLGESITFISRVVDATFPNYRDIIPKQFTSEATLLKSDFSEALRKARVVSGNEQHIGLHVYPKKKMFTATAQSAAIGEMSDSLEAALSGEDLDINFHINYLSDSIPPIEADSVTLGFSGAGKPLVIRSAADTSFTYLVMPLNR